MRIAPQDDARTQAALRSALASPLVVFTSPNAVRCAAMLAPLRGKRGRRVFAIGAGTAAALRRAGIADVQVPARADSDALLALEALRDLDGRRVGLVTAPAGLVRADVYARTSVPPSARAWNALRATRGKPAIALSSGDALETLMAHVPDDLRTRVLGARILAGSERLADIARGHGFTDIRVAAGARPADLLAAARDGRPRRAIR